MGENLGRELLKRRVTMRDQYLGGRELQRWAKYGYGSTWHDYQNSFEVVSPEPIAQWLQERRRSGKGTAVLDVMSPTDAVASLKRDANIQGGIALTLEDLRPPERRAAEAEQNIHVVAGDVVGKQVWRRLREQVSAHNIHDGSGFDLILSRSIGGANNIPVDRGLYYFLMKQMYENLSGNDGLMLVQCPSYSERDALAWRDVMAKFPGLDYRTGYAFNPGSAVIALRKHANAPEQLPKLL